MITSDVFVVIARSQKRCVSTPWNRPSKSANIVNESMLSRIVSVSSTPLCDLSTLLRAVTTSLRIISKPPCISFHRHCYASSHLCVCHWSDCAWYHHRSVSCPYCVVMKDAACLTDVTNGVIHIAAFLFPNVERLFLTSRMHYSRPVTSHNIQRSPNRWGIYSITIGCHHCLLVWVLTGLDIVASLSPANIFSLQFICFDPKISKHRWPRSHLTKDEAGSALTPKECLLQPLASLLKLRPGFQSLAIALGFYPPPKAASPMAFFFEIQKVAA